MRRVVGSAFVVGLALGPVAAFAQATAAAPVDPSSSALPLETQTGYGLVPGKGPTGGVVMMLDNPAVKCFRDALKAADGHMTPNDAVTTCNEAITSPAMPRPDVAGSLVNRGVLLMTMMQEQEAKRDFDRALELEPDAAEAFVNRGIILFGEGKLSEALADLDRGIALGPERPERAYYTRGLVREDLKDVQGAYSDLKVAEQIKPDWPPVLNELRRFTVVNR